MYKTKAELLKTKLSLNKNHIIYTVCIVILFAKLSFEINSTRSDIIHIMSYTAENDL